MQVVFMVRAQSCAADEAVQHGPAQIRRLGAAAVQGELFTVQ
jgi:hypothetical protein